MYGNKFNSQQEANVACCEVPRDNVTTPAEQTVGDTLRGLVHDRFSMFFHALGVASNTPRSVLDMPVSQFRKINNLL